HSLKESQLIMFRQYALRLAMLAMLALIVLNAVLAYTNFRRLQRDVAAQRDNAGVRADLSGVLQDLTTMDSARLGYLISGEQNYLQPYQASEATLRTHLANLHAAFANRQDHEVSLLRQLESLSQSKLAEMQKTIDLRQHDFRLRSFGVIYTNEG